jgi:hypothetical protein
MLYVHRSDGISFLPCPPAVTRRSNNKTAYQRTSGRPAWDLAAPSQRRYDEALQLKFDERDTYFQRQ